MLTNSKIEVKRTDTWTVKSWKALLASWQLLVAQREAFLTRLGLEEGHASIAAQRILLACAIRALSRLALPQPAACGAPPRHR
jgi:hypothetical protein